jgi:hypothetical protein
MRQEFVEVATIQEAQAAAPWAAEIVEVEGGFQAFESMADYDTWLRSCDQDLSTSESDEETTGAVQPGFVLGSDGRIYVQVPADNQWGFSICDDDQSWPGGFSSGLESWTLLANDDQRITEDDRERVGWILDELDIADPDCPLIVTWEFMGPASQQKFDVAQAVADAMVAMESPVVTPGVVNRACEQLGNGWDADSVYSAIENCSFALEDNECESA